MDNFNVDWKPLITNDMSSNQVKTFKETVEKFIHLRDQSIREGARLRPSDIFQKIGEQSVNTANLLNMVLKNPIASVAAIIIILTALMFFCRLLHTWSLKETCVKQRNLTEEGDTEMCSLFF